MNTWVRRIRGMAGMGLIWAIGGAVAGGVLELIDNIAPGLLPFIARVDMWPQTLAIPGFIGGVLFAAVLMLAGRRRRFDELSLPRFAGWGALAGALLGSIGVANGLPFYVLGITTLGGAVTATGALALARRGGGKDLAAPDGRRRELDGSGDDPPRPLARGG